MEAPLKARPTAAAAESILSFWFEESKPYQWFRRDTAFDDEIRRRFGALHDAAKAGKLDAWRTHPQHCLALIILLDQFSRNIYRDDPRAFAQDEQALDVAREALRRRFDQLYGPKERAFFYMPFMHSENLRVQEECVALFKAQLPGTMNLPFAIEHRDIIDRFGRFPHRNKILGRKSTPDEITFLKAGGFNP
ncbi:DUF924 family protein [Hyphococcus sp.]|uniref:DUF924 family protein n=1 Tax=Hyphococcus sp. TaxID=2038636 RepID=UPI003CCBD123